MTLTFERFLERINQKLVDNDSEENVKTIIFNNLNDIGLRYLNPYEPENFGKYYKDKKETFSWQLAKAIIDEGNLSYHLVRDLLNNVTNKELPFFAESRRLLSEIEALADSLKDKISIRDKYKKRILTLLQAPKDPEVQKDLKFQYLYF